MNKEQELLEKLEKVLTGFSKVQITVGASPLIAKVVEVMAEAAIYLRSKLEESENDKAPNIDNSLSMDSPSAELCSQ